MIEPLTYDKLYSQRTELTFYAEAAPGTFLHILDSVDEAVLEEFITTPTDPIFGEPIRTTLLWALEGIAWDPEFLPEVCCLLAKLSQYRIQDNFANTPKNSFNSILKSWYPQTLATLEQRKNALELVINRYPETGWELALTFFGNMHDMAIDNYKPSWRRDLGLCSPEVTHSERLEFENLAFNLCINVNELDMEAFSILVQRVSTVHKEWSDKIWERIKKWATSNSTTDKERANLREEIRQKVLLWCDRANLTEGEIYKSAREVYDILEPKCLIWKHHWLFASPWVELHDKMEGTFEKLKKYGESDDQGLENFYLKEQERVRELRKDVLFEIYQNRGFDGILELAEHCGGSGAIGAITNSIIKDSAEKISFFLQSYTLAQQRSSNQFRFLGSGLLHEMPTGEYQSFLASVRKELNEEEFVKVLTLSPINKELLEIVDTLDESHRAKYWGQADFEMCKYQEQEADRFVDGLLKANRPVVALKAFLPQKISSKNIFGILAKILSYQEKTLPPPYEIEKYFEVLSGRAEYSEEDLAFLEIRYLPLLAESEYGIPNLESQVKSNPRLFVEAIAGAYNRSDGLDDHREWMISEANREVYAHSMYRLLRSLKNIPGTNHKGEIDEKELIAWVRETRNLCVKHSRAKIGDQQIGNLLSKGPVGKDNVWPCEEICKAMELINTESFTEGFCTGKINARGVVQGEMDGKLERELAEQFRSWSMVRKYQYPYAGRVLVQLSEYYNKFAHGMEVETAMKHRLYG